MKKLLILLITVSSLRNIKFADGSPNNTLVCPPDLPTAAACPPLPDHLCLVDTDCSAGEKCCLEFCDLICVTGVTAQTNATTAAVEATTAAVETTTAAADPTTGGANVTTTPAPAVDPTTPYDMGGLTVMCTQDYMEATLDVTKHPNINLDRISLEDDSCQSRDSNRTHVSFRTDLDKCGTKHNTTDKYIIYYNAILANTNGSTAPHPIISRDFQAAFPFQCSYPRRQVLSVTSFSPRKVVVYTREAEFGNFTFLMDMYRTDEYKDVVDSYPHPVRLGDDMFFKVRVISKDSKLVLFIKNAKATPTSDFDDGTDYQFIEDGCSKDSTLDYKYDNKSSSQQFSIAAFRFINENTDEIFIHAELLVCRSDDAESVCAKGCENAKRRRRRSAVDAPSAMLYVGPLQVSQSSSAGSAAGGAAGTSVGTVGIIAASLGALVLVLIVALVVVFRRRGAAPSPKIVFTKVTGEEGNRLV